MCRSIVTIAGHTKTISIGHFEKCLPQKPGCAAYAVHLVVIRFAKGPERGKYMAIDLLAFQA